MPLIYLQTHDGARIPVPEGAAQLSGVVRRVLDSWEEMYGVLPQGSTLESGTNVCSDSDSERTPDRIGDDDDDLLTTIGNRNVSLATNTFGRSSSTKRASRCRKVIGVDDAGRSSSSSNSDDTDGTASVLEDDVDNDSPSPSLFSLLTGSRRRKAALGEMDRVSPHVHQIEDEGDRDEDTYEGAEKMTMTNNNGFTAMGRNGWLGEGTRGTVYDDSATPSTLDNDDSRGSVEEGEGQKVGTECNAETGDRPVVLPQKQPPDTESEISSQPNSTSPVDCVHSLDSVEKEGPCHGGRSSEGKDPFPSPADTIPELTEPCVEGSTVEALPSDTGGLDPPEDEELPAHNECDATIVVAAASPGTDEAEEGLTQDVCWTPGAGSVIPSFTPTSQTNEGLASPGSYHQRTPCMIGDEDDVVIHSATCASPTNDDTSQLFTLSRQPRPQSNRSRELSPPAGGFSCLPGERSLSPRGNSGSARADSVTQTRRQQFSISALHEDSRGAFGEVVTSPLRQCMHITDEEIVIKLQGWFSGSKATGESDAGGQATLKTGGSDGPREVGEAVLFHSSEKLSLGKSLNNGIACADDVPVPEDVAPHGEGSPSPEASTASETRRIQSVCSPTVDEHSSRASSVLATDAVQYCAVYLRHFATSQQRQPYESGRQEPPLPTNAPEPLTVPLIALLSPWERDFIYRDILGQTEEQVSQAMAIVNFSPNMNYTYPAPFLKVPGVCQALLVEPPSADRVALLLRVMRAAEVLQVPSLQNLCAAWCADFIVRASYGARDHFEAAALVRKCFQVQNDWTRKEMECLKLENEWPVDEEE